MVQMLRGTDLSPLQGLGKRVTLFLPGSFVLWGGLCVAGGVLQDVALC